MPSEEILSEGNFSQQNGDQRNALNAFSSIKNQDANGKSTLPQLSNDEGTALQAIPLTSESHQWWHVVYSNSIN